jgi:HSP20 family protein
MKLIPWRGRGEVANFQSEFDELMTRFYDPEFETKLPPALSRATVPPINVSESEKNWTITVELPGLNEKDIQVQLIGNHLRISAERKWEDEKKGKEFHRVESQYGAFQRSMHLPANARLDPEAIVASYKKGMLEVMIPKVEPTPTAKIPVKAG